MSISQLFEIAVNNMDNPEDDWRPTEGSAVAKILTPGLKHSDVSGATWTRTYRFLPIFFRREYFRH
jgi:hypothetical protein